jgi:BlaI family penicillinase repressor
MSRLGEYCVAQHGTNYVRAIENGEHEAFRHNLRRLSLTITKTFVYRVLIMESGTIIPRPTEAELELLQILWQKEPATVREIHEMLNQEKLSGYTTVLKLLQIMTTKGLVIRDEANRAHVYRAAFTQDMMQSRLLRDLSNRLFAGSAAQLALHALSMEPASEVELNEIRALLERKRNTGSLQSSDSHKSSRKDRP